jgi:hypothetical protein
MWLVLCSPHDAAALWALTGLRRRGLVPIEAISPEALVYSRALTHQIANGQPHTTFTLPDGRVIDSASVQGVLNRVTALPLAHLAGASPEDALYAQQELHALMLSVLYGLGARVVNRPTPQGLAGRPRSDAEWLALAGRAGFRTQDYREDDVDGIKTSGLPEGTAVHVIVFDHQVYGAALPADVHARAIGVARLAGARLLGMDLIACSDDDWWFGAASILPDLWIGGEGLLDALTPALGGPAA